MTDYISKIFEDESTIKKIKSRLPFIFQIAEIDSKRGGQTGIVISTLTLNKILEVYYV